MKIFFAGEGADELGEWAGHPAYHPRPSEKGIGGILHALVERYSAEHTVGGATQWRHVRKYKAGKHDRPETQTVLGLALRAEELKCDVLVFVRDRDRDEERERDVERGIMEAKARFAIPVVGGTANEEIEAWLLALRGERESETHADAKRVLRDKYGVETRDQKVAVVSEAKAAADDCTSLTRWRERAKPVFEPV
jgi:hypothetical protein